MKKSVYREGEDLCDEKTFDSVVNKYFGIDGVQEEITELATMADEMDLLQDELRKQKLLD